MERRNKKSTTRGTVIVVFRAMKSKVAASARRTCFPGLMSLLSWKENSKMIVGHSYNSGDTLHIWRSRSNNPPSSPSLSTGTLTDTIAPCAMTLGRSSPCLVMNRWIAVAWMVLAAKTISTSFSIPNTGSPPLIAVNAVSSGCQSLVIDSSNVWPFLIQ